MNYSLPRPIFNVRIYGIFIENGAVLVSDEVHHERNITKFPGGGLQFGESTHECVKREFMEELQLEIIIKEHFYTVDFFQASAFDPTQQVISIYYIVESVKKTRITVSDKKFDFLNRQNGTQSLRWIAISDLIPEDFTFPIDQKVSGLVFERFHKNKS
ncbi:MAG: NUDIX domain-containing protein [Bacteroidota bacterium]|nr:NUDIX domain-containing protein [Bacteroidota bacterium]